ncbi:hypothetical protein ACA910_018838 [Epithemia clementina (nom. ined.)]
MKHSPSNDTVKLAASSTSPSLQIPIQQRQQPNKRQHQILLATIPGCLGFSSAHTLINKERAMRGRPALKRNTHLDYMCQLHAETMAEQQKLLHLTDSQEESRHFLNSNRVGEIIQRGPSVEVMHEQTMEMMRTLKTTKDKTTTRTRIPTATKNILGRHFREFGVGTARGEDGKLYMVQLFRGDVVVVDNEKNRGSLIPKDEEGSSSSSVDEEDDHDAVEDTRT